jgi:hypothetical protein
LRSADRLSASLLAAGMLASHDANPGVVNGMQRHTDGGVHLPLIRSPPRKRGSTHRRRHHYRVTHHRPRTSPARHSMAFGSSPAARGRGEERFANSERNRPVACFERRTPELKRRPGCEGGGGGAVASAAIVVPAEASAESRNPERSEAHVTVSHSSRGSGVRGTPAPERQRRSHHTPSVGFADTSPAIAGEEPRIPSPLGETRRNR